MSITLLNPDLASLSKTYGKVYDIDQGQVAYTKMVEPKGVVLQSNRDQLRYYMYRKKLLTVDPNQKYPKTDPLYNNEPTYWDGKSYGIWEHAWGLTSVLQDGLPTTADLLTYKMKQAFKAGVLKIDDPEKFAADILKGYADTGTAVHKAAENVLLGKEVTIAGRDKKEQWCIISFANWLNDIKIRSIQTEQIVAHDNVIGGVRVLFAGTVDLIAEIYNEDKKIWETWLIDFKTSADVHLSHKLQVLGYGAAAAQSLGIKIDRYGILLLGKRTVKGYLLAPVGNERRKITFDDTVMTYNMASLMNGGKLPEPTYKVFPLTIQFKQDKPKEGTPDGDNTNSSADNSIDSGSSDQAAPTQPSTAKPGNRPAHGDAGQPKPQQDRPQS